MMQLREQHHDPRARGIVWEWSCARWPRIHLDRKRAYRGIHHRKSRLNTSYQ